ncbi:Holliday junction branch migration protein RuvA [Bifidobacterium aquikefiri]|uniref:Holliday junction branch migration complex subunit RuvA n=1 Tax=Bifidobacterium aquikefiri TaxID=1653207 RepID=A0A261G717_9BIFI|nr:Holliday junction branch migration protein RuvA [Bifidobacterium aquikefiri]OZG66985.1 Holliday junction ATP-dependent DNA helicase RuvA [Bifidobacterium aquikefiri]
MIGMLRGNVLAVEADSMLLDVNGIGFDIRMPKSDLSTLRANQSCSVHTVMNVSQDAVTLFGFTASGSKELFLQLQKASGIGPKVALSILSTLNPKQLIKAIADGDSTALSRAPGLGKKGAQKIILELSGKVDIPSSEASEQTQHVDAGSEQVVQGLMSLGWQEKEARQAVRKVCEGQHIEEPIVEQDIPNILRMALTSLDKGR